MAPALGEAFHPSAVLAAAVSAAAGVPVTAGALKTVKATAQQVGLTRSERAANVQGTFRVPPEGKAVVVGRRLVLVDDVLTLALTLKAARGRLFAAEPPMSMC